MGQRTFGENRDDVAVCQCLINIVVGFFQQGGIFFGGRDGNGPRGPEYKVGYRYLENLVVHHKSHGPSDIAPDDQRVNETDVVGCNNAGARFR